MKIEKINSKIREVQSATAMAETQFEQNKKVAQASANVLANLKFRLAALMEAKQILEDDDVGSAVLDGQGRKPDPESVGGDEQHDQGDREAPSAD